MKHKFVEDATVNIKLDIPTEALEYLDESDFAPEEMVEDRENT